MWELHPSPPGPKVPIVLDFTKPHTWLVFAGMLIITGFILNQIASRVKPVDQLLTASGLNN